MTELRFGTGGLRAKLGDGAGCINTDTIRAATRGVAKWVLAHAKLPASVVIAWDSRRNSELFARETALVFSQFGIDARLFSRLMPTPVLSFAVRHLGCAAGIMITASHNPAEYNGYKVYGPDGGQITDKAANEIQDFIGGSDVDDCVNHITRRGDIKTLSGDVEEAYYDAVLSLKLEACALPLSVVYTPLNGTGLIPVTTVLRRAGFADLAVVSSQEQPDGDFPTCRKPNPEEAEALREGIVLLDSKNSDILLATDPDCDRVGVAVNTRDGTKILNGNEIGILLFDYICRRRIENGTMPKNPVAVKTVVTAGFAEKIAADYGIELRSMLIGFKYIGEQISILNSQGESDRFIFGFEESCGYLSGTHVRDKDAVNACLLICGMAAWYKSRGVTLTDALDALYKKHGYYSSKLAGLTLSGESDKMAFVMQKLRENPPNTIGGFSVVEVRDFLGCTGLPKSDFLQYRLEGGVTLTVRPSGTEPKMKIYCEAYGADCTHAFAAADDCVESVCAIIENIISKGFNT